jgi:hypothetical protein
MSTSRKTITLEIENDGEEALVRGFHAMLQEMNDLARTAPNGRIVDQLEDLAVEKGRDTLRATLEHAVQQHIDGAEKKGRRSVSVRAAKSGKTEASPNVDS